MKLRDLWRISGRLSTELKIQLAHSCILSFVDYCNGAYELLSESNLKKLQKIQNDAVRFIFGIYGYKEKWQPISPLLKKLHFLPVWYGIQYKVSILVSKWLNNMAPEYLFIITDFEATSQ